MLEATREATREAIVERNGFGDLSEIAVGVRFQIKFVVCWAVKFGFSFDKQNQSHD